MVVSTKYLWVTVLTALLSLGLGPPAIFADRRTTCQGLWWFCTSWLFGATILLLGIELCHLYPRYRGVGHGVHFFLNLAYMIAGSLVTDNGSCPDTTFIYRFAQGVLIANVLLLVMLSMTLVAALEPSPPTIGLNHDSSGR